MGVYWDESHKMDGGHFLSRFTAQLLIAVEGQQNLICQEWLNTYARLLYMKAFSSDFQIVSPALSDSLPNWLSTIFLSVCFTTI